MFRRGWTIAWLSAVVALPLSAQEVAVRQYRAALDELEIQHADLIDRADQFDDLMATTQDRVVVSVGAFAINTPAEYAEMVRVAATEAHERIRFELGVAADEVSPFELTLDVAERMSTTRATRIGPFRFGGDQPVMVHTVELVGSGNRTNWASLNAPDIPDVLAVRLTNFVYGWLRTAVTPEFNGWSGTTIRPNPDYAFRSNYRELTSSSLAVTRACRVNNDACLHALGLSNGPDRWDMWFPGEDIITRAHWEAVGVGGSLPAWVRRVPEDQLAEIEACAARDRASCLAFLKTHAPPTPPIGSADRQGVLEAAFRMAGEDGVSRMLAAEGTTLERLEFIAGAPIDAILTEWKTLATAEVGKPLTVPLRTGLSAVVWIVAFAGMGMRSTRWR